MDVLKMNDMSYKGKYTGSEIDTLLDKVNSSGSSEVDTSMSDTSTNAVQNKVIKAYVDEAISQSITNALNTAI